MANEALLGHLICAIDLKVVESNCEFCALMYSQIGIKIKPFCKFLSFLFRNE
jgi:hypothetical protein